MKCPHCNKEVFSRGHDVNDLYEESKELTTDEKLKKRIEELGDLLGELYDEASYERAGEWVIENKDLQKRVNQALKVGLTEGKVKKGGVKPKPSSPKPNVKPIGQKPAKHVLKRPVVYNDRVVGPS